MCSSAPFSKRYLSILGLCLLHRIDVPNNNLSKQNSIRLFTEIINNKSCQNVLHWLYTCIIGLLLNWWTNLKTFINVFFKFLSKNVITFTISMFTASKNCR